MKAAKVGSNPGRREQKLYAEMQEQWNNAVVKHMENLSYSKENMSIIMTHLLQAAEDFSRYVLTSCAIFQSVELAKGLRDEFVQKLSGGDWLTEAEVKRKVKETKKDE